jgi:hypothetical protein
MVPCDSLVGTDFSAALTAQDDGRHPEAAVGQAIAAAVRSSRRSRQVTLSRRGITAPRNRRRWRTAVVSVDAVRRRATTRARGRSRGRDEQGDGGGRCQNEIVEAQAGARAVVRAERRRLPSSRTGVMGSISTSMVRQLPHSAGGATS